MHPRTKAAIEAVDAARAVVGADAWRPTETAGAFGSEAALLVDVLRRPNIVALSRDQKAASDDAERRRDGFRSGSRWAITLAMLAALFGGGALFVKLDAAREAADPAALFGFSVELSLEAAHIPRFHRLQARARAVEVLGGSLAATKDAYAAMGAHILETCEVIVAVWNGRPAAGRGGAADVVAAALSMRTFCVWIHATQETAPRLLGGDAGLDAAIASATTLSHEDLAAIAAEALRRGASAG